VFDVSLDELPPPAAPESQLVYDEATRSARAQADPELIAALQEVLMLAASDLHVTSNAPPMIRVDGALRPVEGYPVWSRERVARAIKSILTPQQIEAFEENLELDLAYTVSANARFRVNIYQQRGAIGGAFRLIPTGIKNLEELGMPESLGRFAELPRGLVLVTGPTGSGKSTTLAALVDLVNRTRADHIVTIEDPIEFLHSNHKSLVNQREVGADTHSFANGLKHVLRQDPDVILIGELRDLETISVALTAAETGHLVFATLHTQDAPQTIDRVIDVFPPHQQGQVRAQLAATLQGVVCQTLVKRASGRGRAAATEVMMATPAIANLIREGKTFQIASAMQAGRGLGMHTMDQHLAELVNAGIITHEAALEKAHDADGIGRLIQRVESPIEATTRAMAAGSIDFGDSYSGGIDQ
jgi:twitching motility protein PilT